MVDYGRPPFPTVQLSKLSKLSLFQAVLWVEAEIPVDNCAERGERGATSERTPSGREAWPVSNRRGKERSRNSRNSRNTG